MGEGHLDVFKLQGIISIFGADKARDEIDETTEHAERKGSKLLSTLSKIGAAAIAAGAAAVVAVGKQALLAYADYEQLVGGVDTLFKESSAKVQEYAANAFKTAGLSANEYMETVTSFSASLLQSLGGDTEAAAKMADIAITDMSDNANKMGTDMASIQNAYQGFAKQNYTMLDNLKLGYGGTKEEMQRLINHANALNAAQGKLTNYSIDSYADIVSAIHDVQTEMGITGTTAEEASTTIQGSMNSMKGAWKNLLVGIADENANFKGLTSDFVDSLVTVGGNLIPRINIIIEGLTQLITEASQTIIPLAVQTLLENLPSIIAAGMDLVMALVNGILNNINLVITCIINLVDVIVDKLIENLPKLIEGGVRLVIALAGGLIKAIPQLVARIPEIIAAIVQGFAAGGKQMLEVGVNIVKGVWEGIKSAAAWIKEKVTGFFGGIVDGVKDFLGIHSPSKVFAGIGGYMAEGLGEGFDDEFKSVKDGIESSMDFDDVNASIGLGATEMTPDQLAQFAETADNLNTTIANSWKNIAVFYENIRSGAIATADSVIAKLKDTVKNTAERFEEIKSAISKATVSIDGNVTTSFDKIENIISGSFESAKTNTESIWNHISEIIASEVKNISSNISTMVRNMISAIDQLMAKLNELSAASSQFGGISTNINKATKPGVGSGVASSAAALAKAAGTLTRMKMASGGILERGQIGFLEGDGAEAVVPLDQNRKWISAVAEDMNGSLGGNKQVQELKEAFNEFRNDLPDMLIDAFTAMKFDVNNREFARLVKAVN